MEKVKGTQIVVPPIEIGVTTVYIRTNIQRVDDADFIGWEYDEEQLTKDDFIFRMQQDNEQIKQSLAENSTVLLEFMESMLVGGI